MPETAEAISPVIDTPPATTPEQPATQVSPQPEVKSGGFWNMLKTVFGMSPEQTRTPLSAVENMRAMPNNPLSSPSAPEQAQDSKPLTPQTPTNN